MLRLPRSGVARPGDGRAGAALPRTRNARGLRSGDRRARGRSPLHPKFRGADRAHPSAPVYGAIRHPEDPSIAEPPTPWDVAIVGAGPAGSTCAYALAERGLRVLLLEKGRFPRGKVCGNLVDPTAQRHLARMGVLDGLLARGEAHYSRSGRSVSPSGRESGAAFHHFNRACALAGGGSAAPPSAGAGSRGPNLLVKRLFMDEQVARAAQSVGAELIEGVEITGAEYSAANQGWRLFTTAETYAARMLVLADGAHSRLARKLGIVTGRPQAICSSAPIEGGSHSLEWDEVFYLDPELLPGYAALFRLPGDELNYCCYLLPGGTARAADLARLHGTLPARNPAFARHLGARFRLGPMRSGWLRVGGVPRSYADAVLVVGDAAGQVDPISGGGIHHAMDAAVIAAETIVGAFEAGDLGAARLAAYQTTWASRWQARFDLSRAAAHLAATPANVEAWFVGPLAPR